jgi:hypothetical protein
VQFTNLDTNLQLLTSTTHGRYTTTGNNIGTTPPRQIGLTFRLDF